MLSNLLTKFTQHQCSLGDKLYSLSANSNIINRSVKLFPGLFIQKKRKRVDLATGAYFISMLPAFLPALKTSSCLTKGVKAEDLRGKSSAANSPFRTLSFVCQMLLTSSLSELWFCSFRQMLNSLIM